MAFNNTYGLEIISQGAFDMATANLTMKGGCLDQIDRKLTCSRTDYADNFLECQILGDLSDPDNVAVNTTVTNICLAAYLFCFNNVQTAYVNATSKVSFRYELLQQPLILRSEATMISRSPPQVPFQILDTMVT